MADYYRDLAADYDWLYDDDALTDGFAITRPAVADLLQRVGPGCAVLDAACGTGVDAAALARRGFHVRAADGSDAMVEAAAARFRREGLAIPIQQCLWPDLHGRRQRCWAATHCDPMVNANRLMQGCIKTFRQARGWAGRVILRSRWFRSQICLPRVVGGRSAELPGLPAGVTVDSRSAGDTLSSEGSRVRTRAGRSPHLLAGLAA